MQRAVPEQASPSHRRLVVATPIGPDDAGELAQVSWPRTILRLALDPARHPWERNWRLSRRGPLYAFAAAALVLLLFALSGCASTPPISLRQWASASQPTSGARCETVLVSQEIQVPPEGTLSDVRLTIQDIPEVAGKLRILVRQPRFASTLEVESEQRPGFNRVLDIPAFSGRRQLTLVFGRPRSASSDWPRSICTSCRVDVELTALFGAREGLDAYFGRAMQEAASIEAAFSAQSPLRAAPEGAPLRDLGDALVSEASRCGVAMGPMLSAVQTALDELDRARLRLYASDQAELPDAAAVHKAWDAAAAAIEAVPFASAAARAAGWPSSLRVLSAGKLHVAALHLEAAAQLAALPEEDKPIAAQWIALALGRDASALDKRAALLPRLRDLADAEARLDWVDPSGERAVRIPGLSRPAAVRIREWRAARHGRKCIGPGGAVPVRDPSGDARLLATLLGANAQMRLRVAHAADLPAVRETIRRSGQLLCEPIGADLSDLFAGLEEKELGPVADRLEVVFAGVDPREPDDLDRALYARTAALFCKLFDAENIRRRVTSVAGYKVFVAGGTHVLELLPTPLVCSGHRITAREIRRRLREAYREALDRHALTDRLCPVRSGKCPEEVASSVRRIFSLQRPELAAPAAAESRSLDFPPPFGFSDAWVEKLDRCAREACEALSRLRSEAPPGQFEGQVCAPHPEAPEQPQEVTIERPESPTSVTLSSCDAHAGVRLTLRRAADAGTLVAIASSHQFRYGSESVNRQGRHPQLGRIYERVADLNDASDVSRRSEGIFEVSLTPTVPNQVFYFFSLRRRDY